MVWHLIPWMSDYLWRMAFQSFEFPSQGKLNTIRRLEYWGRKGKKIKDTLNFSREGTILAWFLRKWHWTTQKKKAIPVSGRPLTECVFQGLYKYKTATRVCGGVVESPERASQMSVFRTADSFPPTAKAVIWNKHFRQRWRLLGLLTLGVWTPWRAQLEAHLHGQASSQPSNWDGSKQSSCRSLLKIKCFCETLWVQCFYAFQWKAVFLEISWPGLCGCCSLSELDKYHERWQQITCLEWGKKNCWWENNCNKEFK